MPHQRLKYMSDPTPEKQCHNTCQVKGQVKAPVFSGTSSPTVISNREPLWACELNSCQYFRIALLGRAAWQNLRSPTRSGIAFLTWGQGSAQQMLRRIYANATICISRDRSFCQPAWPSCATPNQIRDRVMLLQSIGRNQGFDYCFLWKKQLTIQSCIGSAIPDLVGDRRFWQAAWQKSAILTRSGIAWCFFMLSIGRNQGLGLCFLWKKQLYNHV